MSTPDARLTLPTDDELQRVLAPKLPAWCALSGWHFVAAVGVALFFAYHSYLHLFYSDLWGHVAYGEWILQHQRLPTEEPFVSLAAGVPVIATAWGGQVLLALAARTGDNEWLSHVFAVTVWLSYLVLARAFWFRTRHGGVALTAALMAWFISWGRHAIIRPEMFGVLCFFTLLWLLARARHEFTSTILEEFPHWACPGGSSTSSLRGNSTNAGSAKANEPPGQARWGLRELVTLLGIGVVFAAWANLHGSAIVGIAFVGCYFAGRSVELLWRHRDWKALWQDADWRFWLMAIQVAVLGMCCNPYGIDLLIHTLLFAQHPNLRDIVEWYPLKMVSLEGITVGASWVLAAVLLRHSRVPMRAGDVCVLAFFTWAVATKVRMVAWYAPVAMWVLAPHLADVLARLEFDRRRREWLPMLATRSFRWTAVVGLLAWVTMCFTPISRVVLGEGKHREERQLYSKGTPLELTRYLCEHQPQGVVCGPQWWGDWLVWQGPPNLNVMVTTNAVHLVPPRVWRDYLSIANAPAPVEPLLTRYRVNTVIADKSRQTALIRQITSSPAWEVKYEDEFGLVAVRRSAGSTEFSDELSGDACLEHHEPRTESAEANEMTEGTR